MATCSERWIVTVSPGVLRGFCFQFEEVNVFVRSKLKTWKIEENRDKKSVMYIGLEMLLQVS